MDSSPAIERDAWTHTHYRPIRHVLGISAFGVTAWVAHAAGDTVINEHDEGDPTVDEELFLVVRGHAVFDIDGTPVDGPVGTLVSVAPGVRRSARARQQGTTVILIEGTPGAAYDARGWELWSPLAPPYFAGEYALVASTDPSPRRSGRGGTMPIPRPYRTPARPNTPFAVRCMASILFGTETAGELTARPCSTPLVGPIRLGKHE